MKFSPKNSKLGPNLKWHFNKLHLTISQFCLCSPCKKKKERKKNFLQDRKPRYKVMYLWSINLQKKEASIYSGEYKNIQWSLFNSGAGKTG